MGTGIEIRPLQGNDEGAVVKLGLGLEARYDLAVELGSGHSPWIGFWQDGALAAVHRAVRFGPYLHLKGLFVATRHQGTAVGLMVARAMLEHTSACGATGALAWIEPGKPERALADRLRIAPRGPMVHRFGLPVPGVDVGRRPRLGHGVLSGFKGPLAVDLLEAGAIHWTMDQDRMVLGATPAGPPQRLLAVAGGVAREMGARNIEFAVAAADLGALMDAQAARARRLSRATVCLGLKRFNEISASACI